MAEHESTADGEEPCDVHGWRDCKRCRNRRPVYDLNSAHRKIVELGDELRTVRAELAAASELAHRRATLLDKALTRQVELAEERDEARARLAAIGGESGWVAAENADPDEHRQFTMDDYRDQLGGARRRPRIGEE